MKRLIKYILSLTPAYAWLVRMRQRQAFARLTSDEQRALEFYKAIIQSGDLVFDVGANMGNRTKVFLVLGAKVVAFEPQAMCIEYLKNVLKGNPQFILQESALGSKEGWADMLTSEAHVISTLSDFWVKVTQESGRFSNYAWEGRQRVRVETLDAALICYGLPAFIKIDVEGFEYEVLLGLKTPVRAISLEFAAESISMIKDCMERLAELGRYEYRFSRDESFVFFHDRWISMDEMKLLLVKLTEADPMVWGDVYARRIE